MKVMAILPDNAFALAMPAWRELVIAWQDLDSLPRKWSEILSQWRGIYYIFDRSERKGYVGSAYGEENVLGRWRNCAARGNGGNRLLRGRDPQNFEFSILERTSRDMPAEEVIAREVTWKVRLHSRAPDELNSN